MIQAITTVAIIVVSVFGVFAYIGASWIASTKICDLIDNQSLAATTAMTSFFALLSLPIAIVVAIGRILE